MPWWLAGTSMVATTFAADTPLVVTGMVARYGIAGNWLWGNMAASGMLTVFVYARLWRRAGVMTDVEFAELRYAGRPAAFLRGFRALYLGIPINCIVMGWVNLAMLKILQVTLGQTVDLFAALAPALAERGLHRSDRHQHRLAAADQLRLTDEFEDLAGAGPVQIFDPSGKFIAEWKQFGRPSDIAIDKNDMIYVADSQSNATNNPGVKQGIRIGSAKDGKVTAFIPEPSAEAQAPEGVGVDDAGNVYGGWTGKMNVRRFVKN